MADNPNIKATDEDGNELEDTNVEVDGVVPSDGSGGGSGGAPSDASYVTTDDESGDLSNSEQHANLSGADLHDPAAHSGEHESGGSDEMSVEGLSGDLADPQDPKSHDNADHSEEFVSDGDGTTRQIWVIANGASDPSGASAEDIIFEEEA